MRIPVFILVYLFSFFASAQDSIISRRVFLSEHQSSLNPLLVAQSGKHVFRTDICLLPDQSIDNSNKITQSQYAYQTQLGQNNGLGIFYKTNHSDLLSQSQVGLQYAFRGRLNGQELFKNTDFGIGIGVGFGKEYAHFNNLVFSDQLDTNGIIRPTGEDSISNSVYYPLLNASINLIGNRAYLMLTFNNINSPQTGLFLSNSSRKLFVFNQDIGIKLLSVKQLSCWWTAGLGISADVSAYMGAVLMFNKKLSYHFKLRNLDPLTIGTEQQLAYTTNRIRAYAAYSLPTRKSETIQLTTFRLGLALSITRK
jgi:hypothetical protein